MSTGVPVLPGFDDTSQVSRLVEEEEEEDVVLELDEPARMSPHKRARIINERTHQQLANRKMKVGFHHGQFSPLPASWRYPKGLTVIQLIHLWLIGSPKEHVPPLKKIGSELVRHIDKCGMTRSKMKTLMRQVEHFARIKFKYAWVNGRCWTRPDVLQMWSTIWSRLDPFCTHRP